MSLRVTSHTMKYANTGKTDLYWRIVRDYTELVQLYIDMIHEGTLQCKTFISTKACPVLNDIDNSNWRKTCYQEASQIYRTELTLSKTRHHGKFTKPVIKKHSINLDYHLWDIQKAEVGDFDYFIRITSPYRKSKFRYMTFNVPIKFHRMNRILVDNEFKLNTATMMLTDKGNIKLYWEGEEKEKKEGRPIGVDCGYKKLLACSDGTTYGRELEDIYEKISRKKQGSKAFKRSLIERDNKINRVVKDFYADHKDCGVIVLENLKCVKHKSKFSKKFNNKLQRWSYPKVMSKLERLSETEGFRVVKIAPAYTSQRCHFCGVVDKSSRQGEKFHCRTCGEECDADINAAINILRLGVYSPQGLKT